jgi:hypothetical protein
MKLIRSGAVSCLISRVNLTAFDRPQVQAAVSLGMAAFIAKAPGGPRLLDLDHYCVGILVGIGVYGLARSFQSARGEVTAEGPARAPEATPPAQVLSAQPR